MYVASSLLAVAILAGLILVTILVVRPSMEMTIAVGGQQPTECPAGTGAPACFLFDVTNTSERSGVAGCIVTPAADTDATFTNGSRVQDVPLSAGEVQEVYVKVTPTGGGDTVVEPMLVCRPA